MPDLIKDYVCSDADVHLTSGDPVEAMLTFLTPEGIVGISCPLQVLEALQDRISHRLGGRVPHGPRH